MLAADGIIGATFAPPLSAPQGVAVFQQTAAIADTSHHQLVIVDLAAPSAIAQRLGSRGSSAAAEGFLFPTAAAFTAADHLYVADSGNRHLDHYARTAGVWNWQNSVAPFAGLNSAVGDLVDVTATGGTSLLVLESNGRLLSVDLAAGTSAVALEDARWRRPFSVARTNNSVWVVDAGTHTIYEYDQTFTAVRTFGGYGAGAGRLRTPHGIVVDAASGRIYITEAVGGRIAVFDLTGAAIERLALPSDAAHSLGRGALVAAGRFIVADAGANRVQAITALAPGVASLNLTSLEFGPVGIGYRVVGAISVQNGGTAALNITAVAVRGSSFALDSPAPTLPAPVASGGTLLLPVAFTPQRGGGAYGEVIVTTSSPSAPVLSARLAGEGLVVEPVAIGLVLDTSGSMTQSSGALTKIDRLHQVADLAVDLLAATGTNEVSVARFSSASSVPFVRATLTSGNVIAAQQAIDALPAGGSTSIGAGLQASLADLGPTMLARRNLLVMTDGMENTAPLIAGVPIPNNTTIYTIGLGLPQFVDAAKLETLATRNGGYFQVTDGDDLMLAKFFVQVFSDVIGQQVAADPPVVFGPQLVHDFPLWVSRDDRTLTCVVAWERVGSAFGIEIIDPRGRSTPIGASSRIVRNRYAIVRMPLKGSRFAAVGSWIVRVRATTLAAAQEHAIVSVLVDSDLHLRWELEARPEAQMFGAGPVASAATTDMPVYPPRTVSRPPSGLRVGDGLTFRALAASPGARILQGALEVRPPAESLTAALKRAALINLDDPRREHEQSEHTRPAAVQEHKLLVAGSGQSASFVLPFNRPDGVHWVRVRVEGANASGERWQRERSFQVLVHP